MEKKDLLLDIDEVVCFPGFLKAINEFMNTNYEIDDFQDYYIDEVVIPKERMDEFNRFLNQRNLYEQADILPNAIETIKKLNDFYNIYPCTACINPFDIPGSGRIFADKYNFLIALLPFIPPKNFIFTNTKHLFQAAVQIDDRLSNLNNEIETKILFPSYHNKNITTEELLERNVIRAGYEWRTGWDEIAHLLLPEESKRYSFKK